MVGFVLSTTPLAEMTGPDPNSTVARAFVHGLRDLGCVEGRDVLIERRSAESWLWQSSQRATQDIPIIALFNEDPVAAGLVEAGGLMSYGTSGPGLLRQMAGFVDRSLKGAKPADLPIEQPTKFELVVNLKTAQTLRITLPPSILIRAEEVIE